jgi:hypothetical protein
MRAGEWLAGWREGGIRYSPSSFLLRTSQTSGQNSLVTGLAQVGDIWEWAGHLGDICRQAVGSRRRRGAAYRRGGQLSDPPLDAPVINPQALLNTSLSLTIN